MLPVTVRTPRLTLRPPVAGDAGWIACEIARPEVHQMLTSPPRPYRLADAKSWLQGVTRRTGTFVVEAALPVGVIAVDRDTDGAELGYWLRADAWGRGYMTEAGRAVVENWFEALDGDLVSGHLIENAASGGVLTKLGFQNEARVMRQSSFWGREVELQRMRLTKPRWLEHLHSGARAQ